MKIIYELTKDVSAEDVLALRKACGNDEPLEMWRQAISQSLIVATAHDSDNDNKLVGVGFVVGNNRHAQLVDMVVHPDYRKHGIGSQLFDTRVKYCRDKGILYVGNTYDPKKPWLKDFYEKHDFRPIDFALWLDESVDRVQGKKEG